VHSRVRRFRLKFFSVQSKKISLTFSAFRTKTKMSGAPYTQRVVRIAFAGSVSSLTFAFTRILCIFRKISYTVVLLYPFCATFPLLHILHGFNNIIIIYTGSFLKVCNNNGFPQNMSGPDLTRNKFIFLRPETILVFPEEVLRTACLNVQYTKYNSNA
jgi:hypothetical protein